MYNHITLKDLRPQLPKVIEKVDSELGRYIISKHGEPVAILLSVDDYESMIETLNETTDKENLKNIKQGMKEAKSGKTINWNQVKRKYRLE
ncbi:type II toxin-antitoxin system Phd/YefM family antitoxin [bacterium]|nr:type II toxin-antitoxin system Phd/YefM family antitoxin [bacterium]